MTTYSVNNATLAWNSITFGQLLSYSGPSPKVEGFESIYVSSSTSPSVVGKTPTVVDNGEIKVKVGYDPSVYNAVYTAMIAATVATGSIIVAGGTTTWAFSAYCSGFELGGGTAKEELTLDITLTITGAMTV